MSVLNLGGVFNVQEHEDRVYSQNKEDGIIAELVRRIDPMKYFVEFGVDSGYECNTRLLASQNWGGVQVEARHDCYLDLVKLNEPHRQRVRSVNALVTLDNMEDLFLYVPKNFGLLSIDVDGNDIYIFEKMARLWSPAIVCVEINNRVPDTVKFQQPYDEKFSWNGMTEDSGASLRSMTEMAHEKGYALVGLESSRINAFYVRNDLVMFLSDGT